MDRRTFVLLTGAGSAALVASSRVPAATASPGRRRGGPQRRVGRLRFEFDELRRWSLSYDGDGAPVPLIRGAAVVVSLADRALTLAELEDSTVGTRRPPGGDAVVVRGRAAGVFIEAEFFAAGAAPAPVATVSVTVYPDRYLPTVKGVRFFALPGASLLAGGGPLVALVSGYHSLEPCRTVIAGAPGSTDWQSPAALGLTRAGRGFGLAFDTGEPGEGVVRSSEAGLEAVSDWAPTRPLRPEGDTSRLRLGFDPQGDALSALTALFVPTSVVDRERLAAALAPAGWCSGPELGRAVTEADVVANLAVCRGQFDRRFFRYLELDDGYQRAAGAWEANDKFPHGHAWLTEQIHAAGFKAGLWLAPFAVAEGSGIPAEHPDWLLRDASGPVRCDTRAAWGGAVYALDGAHPKVQEWLSQLARRVVHDWGYDALRVDALHWATVGSGHYGGLTHAEAYRAALGAVRDGLGTEAFLTASAAPLQHTVGLVNGMQVASAAEASWVGVQPAARALGLRSYYQRSTWLNDPGGLIVRAPLTPSEAEAWAALVALGGGVTLFGDNLTALEPERLALLARTLPAAPLAGRPIDASPAEPAAAPALVLGSHVFPIPGPWRFRTDDDPAYATLAFDETAWETIPVPAWWREAGHAGYSGVAWYRARFALPSPPEPSAGDAPVSLALELGQIADADETFVNGVKVGQTGDFPPQAQSEPQGYRRYAVGAAGLKWGGENVLAVRVWGAAGSGGGLWNVRRETPPAAWVVEGAARWWTVVLVNWDDEPRASTLPLAKLGIESSRLAVYDVWRDTPRADVVERVAATLEPRSAVVLALRAAAAHPQVIGTTRHVVQGVVDVAAEAWDAATRTLTVTSRNLDPRAYAVTIAVPKGLRPLACRADVPCTLRRLASGHAVLEWPAGGDGRDISWALSFRRKAGNDDD